MLCSKEIRVDRLLERRDMVVELDRRSNVEVLNSGVSDGPELVARAAVVAVCQR